MPTAIRSRYDRLEALSTGQVVPEPAYCIQCGICSYNCPVGIDVRLYAWIGRAVEDRRCILCGQCVARCPRAVLRFERLPRLDGAPIIQ